MNQSIGFFSEDNPEYPGVMILSDTTLGLITQKIEVEPAEPKAEYVDLPGLDGSADLTEAAGPIRYNDRKIRMTFAVRPDQDWHDAMSAVSNALNGQRFSRIVIFDDSPDWAWTGRCQVERHSTDNMLRQIVVSARVNPYKTRSASKTFEVGSSQTTLTVDLGVMLTYPTLTASREMDVTIPSPVSADTTVRVTTTLTTGPVTNGKRHWTATPVVSGAGTLTVEWTEGSL